MRTPAIAVIATLAVAPAAAKTLEIPFDFSRGALGLEATLKGAPVYLLFDTGVNPSVIDLTRASALGLTIDRANPGEGSGVGASEAPKVFPAVIDGLAVAGEAFPPFKALSGDMAGLSQSYGRAVDGVLGYSFIRTRVFLVDYPRRRLVIAGNAREAARAARLCRMRWSMPFRSFGDDEWPVIPDMRIGAAAGPATLDTGSTGDVTFYPRALDLPGVRAALVEKGEVTHSGFRGDEKSKQYVLNAPIGFGPFQLPAGQTIKLGAPMDAADPRIANIGNRVFAGLQLKVLLDYRGRRITFFGGCGEG